MKIKIYTQVYNAKNYIKQCVDSVLNQTFQDFEFVLIDNGSTDGSGEILEDYARGHSNITLIRFPKNKLYPRWLKLVAESNDGDYLTRLDADDWWEPNYLEHLLTFAEEHQLDIACTGTEMHFPDLGTRGFRNVERQKFCSKNEFAKLLPWYHVFFRTTWGKLVRMDCARAISLEVFSDIPYGLDTLWCFQLLRHANRIGIDNSILHHYRVHPQSSSFQYDFKRFDADICLYNDAIDFLTSFGPVSTQNRSFLQIVYINALADTTEVIQRSKLAPADKLREYRRIVTHPLTVASFKECIDESAVQNKTNLLVRTLEAGAALGKEDDTDLRTVMQMLLPCCGQAVTAANAELFLEDQKLLQVLLRDDADAILDKLLGRLRSNQGVKKYALPKTICALAVEKPLLCQINDAVFLRKYGEIYKKVWRGECLDALDEMANLLMEDKVSGGRETFLTLFVSLAALEEQVPAFFFGKLQLAQLYFCQNRREECRAAVSELDEMGLESKDLIALHQKLEDDMQ